MNGVEKIDSLLDGLPPAYRAEALDFIEFLAQKARQGESDLSDGEWSGFSLTNAMRDIDFEGESVKYSEIDLKSRWR